MKNRLKEVIEYAENPDKTTAREYVDDDLFNVIQYAERDDKTDKKLYVETLNCSKRNACAEMLAVQKRFGSRGEIIAWHGFQSFVTGEVTPEEAFEIGKETARRMWGSKYQVVITEHVNTDNLHCHFVVNPISFVDGSRFQSKIYNHKRLREISDEVCKERGKSVLENSEFYGGKHRNSYWAEKQGHPTHRDLLKKDLEYCLDRSGNWKDFEKQMHGLGYYIDWKRMSVRARDWERSVRLDRIGYTVEAIEERFDRNWEVHPNFSLEVWNYNLPKPKKSVFLSSIAHELGWNLSHTYLMEEMLIDIVFLIIIEAFRLLDTAKNAVILSVELRHCLKDVEQFVSDYRFLRDNGIRTFGELDGFIAKTELELKGLEHERSLIRNRIRHETDRTVLAENRAEREELTREHIAPLRKRLSKAKGIRDISPHLCELLQAELELERPYRRLTRDGRLLVIDDRSR